MRRTLLWMSAAAAFVVVLLLLLHAAHTGTAHTSDGTPAIARVDSNPEGSCLAGAEHSFCYDLHLTVFPGHASSFTTHFTVNVRNRLAYRVRPGAYVWVVIDRNNPRKVYLDVDALSRPAPSAPPADSARPRNK